MTTAADSTTSSSAVPFEETLGGRRYMGRYYPTNHCVLDRVDTRAPNGSREIRILSTKTGVRVNFSGIEGRVFIRTHDLNIVRGKPLFTAELPPGETDYWTNQVLVYGTTEYYGPEFITRVVGVSGGEPIFIGKTNEDGQTWIGVVHGRRHMLQWDLISQKMRIYSGMLAYAAADEMGEELEWYGVVGNTKFGPFDDEPEITCTAYASSMYDRDGHEMANELTITGTRDGQPHVEVVDVRQLLANTEG